MSVISFLFVTVLFSACGPARQIRKSVRQSAVFNRHFTGFSLYSLNKQKTVYEQNADKYFTPASNTKLFTFYTSLKILGDSVPALKYTTRNDSLYFWGTGDPSLMHPDLKSTAVYSFLQSRTEKLCYVGTPLKINYFGLGWSWDDYNGYYSTERAAMPVYGNVMRFKVQPDKTWEVQPRLFKSYFVEKPLLQRILPDMEANFLRDPSSNLFTFDSTGIRRGFMRDVPFRHTEQLLTEMLTDTLHKPVSLVAGTSRQPQQTIYSLPVDSLYVRLMQESDNFIAEQLLLLCASQFSDTLSTENSIAYATKTLLNDLPDAPIWMDGSGLSRYNLFTPRSMVKLLQKIHTAIPQDRLFRILPAGGQSGTIKSFYGADKPYIFAKTGSLSNVHCLSGYVLTKKGHMLLFSFMHNNYTAPVSEIKREMEKVLRLARDKY